MIDPAHLTDAELAAWYGSGLHAPKAQRLIEEVRRLRRELALSAAQYAELERAEMVREQERDALRARLAEVEAERDIGIAEVEAQRDKALADLTEMTAGYTTQMETISGLLPRLREIEARLAEVERALDDELANLADDGARLSHAVVRRIKEILGSDR